MSEHFSRNTSGVMKWCNTCKRTTLHIVSGKKVGACMNNHVKALDKRPYQADAAVDTTQGELF